MKPENGSNQEAKQGLPSVGWAFALALAAMVIIILLTFYTQADLIAAETETTLSDIVIALNAGDLERITVQGDEITAQTTSGKQLLAYKEATISALEALRLLGAKPNSLKGIPVLVSETPRKGDELFSILLIIVPFAFIGYLLYRYAQQTEHQPSITASNLNPFGRSNPHIISASVEREVASEQPVITFADVAGAEQAKLELMEVVEFLKEPEKFIKLGARIPKGVLMAGPPGTGKTLLAKAISGEANAPFFSMSGSEFVEMFVGVGASRVRDLFKRAREQAPAIIFVDEIDAVGRRRGVGLGGGNDEREQTLNQILVEMDGFCTDTNLIIVAATNRPDVLDPALLRPGRFDRKVTLDRPDIQGRKAILNIHVQGKPLADIVDINDLAKLTPGFVGADLENLVNEAAILAARRNLEEIGPTEFQDAMERIVAGPERKSQLISSAERKVVAFHEAGHAVVMHHLPTSDPVHKVSIISRGMALGYTMPLPEGERYLRTKEAFADEIVSLLGGRAAEALVFGRITTGAANDLERATQLARVMVTQYGFSERLGLRTYGETQGEACLGNLPATRDYSEEMARLIDAEICTILDQAYAQAVDILRQYRQRLERLAEMLLETETVDRQQFEMLMVQM